MDEATSEDGVRLLSLLLRMIHPSEAEQTVIVMGCGSPLLEVPGGHRIKRVGRRFNWPIASAPDLQRVFRATRPDAVLAWSPTAGVAARLARHSGGPIGVVLCDPSEASAAARWAWSVGSWFGPVDFLCAGKLVQRRLIERGVSPDTAVVIRPGVDWGRIREAKASMDRAALGLPAEGPVLLLPSPATRTGGQFQGAWAMAVLHQIFPTARMLIPGVSREQQRIRRLIERLDCPHAYVFTGNDRSPESLLAVSSLLVVPALGDVPTGWIPVAMAAGVPVVGSAVPAVTELVADRHNGLLCRAGEPHTLAIRIRTALDSPDVLRGCTDLARGQAYDIFRAQRCVDEYLTVMRNLASGDRAARSVRDAATAG